MKSVVGASLCLVNSTLGSPVELFKVLGELIISSTKKLLTLLTMFVYTCNPKLTWFWPELALGYLSCFTNHISQTAND